MLLRIYLFILLFHGIKMIPSLFAQKTLETAEVRVLRHELGFAAGTSISFGPAYKIRMNRFSVMATFAPIVNYYRENYFGGLTFQYILQSTPVSNFFIYQGNRLQSRTIYNYDFNPIPFKGVEYITLKELLFSHGFGIGYELFRPKQKKNPLGLSLMAGWGVYENFKRGTISLDMSILYKFHRD